MTTIRLTVLLSLLVLLAGASGVIAQDGGPASQGDPGGGLTVAALPGTGFTYQGYLEAGGAPVTGACDFRASLWDAVSSGAQLGGNETVSGAAVTEGRFTLLLNSTGLFGARAFDGSARWLGLAVRCPAGSGSYEDLTPRQAVTPAPLALALPGLRTEQNATSPNVVGGHISNTVSSVAVVGAVIAGGGSAVSPNQVSISSPYATVSGGAGNTAGSDYAVVGGGFGNTADDDYTVVGGGANNTAGGNYATVGGGSNNTASGNQATVGGGSNNTASSTNTTVAGGLGNTATSSYATIGGGDGNTAGSYATIGGGADNTASGADAVVGGGRNNLASGNNATVPGGLANTASGGYSFAAGSNARAVHAGAFVWADNTGAVISSTTSNQFLVRASGGITLYTNSTATTGVRVLPGGGAWASVSDRRLKANFAPVDGRGVLDALMTVPIQTWNYSAQDASIRHMGPMAQDFYATFGVGEDDVTITTVDADGVALAAIQGLYTLVQEKDSEIAALRTSNADLHTRMAALEAGGPAGGGYGQLLLGLVLGAGIAGGAFALGRRGGVVI